MSRMKPNRCSRAYSKKYCAEPDREVLNARRSRFLHWRDLRLHYCVVFSRIATRCARSAIIGGAMASRTGKHDWNGLRSRMSDYLCHICFNHLQAEALNFGAALTEDIPQCISPTFPANSARSEIHSRDCGSNHSAITTISCLVAFLESLNYMRTE